MGVIIWSGTISVQPHFLYITDPYAEVQQFSNNTHFGWMQPRKFLLHSNWDYNFNRNLEGSNFGRFVVRWAQKHKKISSVWGRQLLGGRELCRGVKYNKACILNTHHLAGRNIWTNEQKCLSLNGSTTIEKSQLYLAEGLRGKQGMLLSSPSLIQSVLTTETAGRVLLAKSSAETQ